MKLLINTENVEIKGKEKVERKNISSYLRKKGIKYADIIEIQFYVNELSRDAGILWNDEIRNRFVIQAKKELKRQPLNSENQRIGLHEFAENFLVQLKKLTQDDQKRLKSTASVVTAQPENKSHQGELTIQNESFLYKRIANLAQCSESKLFELDEKIKGICGDFINEEKQKSAFEHSRCLSTESAYKLNELVNDSTFGIAYTALVLKKYSDVLSPGSWADVAKISIEHARLILGDKDVADKICKNGFLASIATNRPEHAKFILEKFGDQLNGQQEMVKFFSKESPHSYRL